MLISRIVRKRSVCGWWDEKHSKYIIQKSFSSAIFAARYSTLSPNGNSVYEHHLALRGMSDDDYGNGHFILHLIPSWWRYSTYGRRRTAMLSITNAINLDDSGHNMLLIIKILLIGQITNLLLYFLTFLT